MAKLPDFTGWSDERIAEFWDTHDSTDYLDDMEECEDTFKRPRRVQVGIRLDPNVLNLVKALAKERDQNFTAYIRMLVTEGLKREMERIKGIEK